MAAGRAKEDAQAIAAFLEVCKIPCRPSKIGTVLSWALRGGGGREEDEAGMGEKMEGKRERGGGGGGEEEGEEGYGEGARGGGRKLWVRRGEGGDS